MGRFAVTGLAAAIIDHQSGQGPAIGSPRGHYLRRRDDGLRKGYGGNQLWPTIRGDRLLATNCSEC